MHAGYWTDGLAHLIAHTFCVSLSLCLQTLCLCVSPSILYFLCPFTPTAFLNCQELTNLLFLRLYSVYQVFLTLYLTV